MSCGKACRRHRARYTLPKPMIASVLSTSEVPTYLLRFHSPACGQRQARQSAQRMGHGGRVARTNLHRRVCLCHVARQRAEERNAVLSCGDGVSRRRVDDQDARLRSGCEVHIVDADSSAADHLEAPLASKQNLAGHLARTRRRVGRQRMAGKHHITHARVPWWRSAQSARRRAKLWRTDRPATCQRPRPRCRMPSAYRCPPCPASQLPARCSRCSCRRIRRQPRRLAAPRRRAGQARSQAHAVRSAAPRRRSAQHANAPRRRSTPRKGSARQARREAARERAQCAPRQRAPLTWAP